MICSICSCFLSNLVPHRDESSRKIVLFVWKS
nr:MAG TPA: hypothetical protein [Microviridae sp.]